MDHLTPEKRSLNMSKIRSKNTLPERMVRKALKKFGIPYRSYGLNLPGKPDIVLKERQTVLFVHGCFWHHHKGCSRAALPRTNQKYWLPKIANNQQRDKMNNLLLKKIGWRTGIIWECEVKKESALHKKIKWIINGK